MWKQVYKHTYNLRERGKGSTIHFYLYDLYLFFCHNFIIRCTGQPSVLTYVLYIILTKDFRILQTGYVLIYTYLLTPLFGGNVKPLS